MQVLLCFVSLLQRPLMSCFVDFSIIAFHSSLNQHPTPILPHSHTKTFLLTFIALQYNCFFIFISNQLSLYFSYNITEKQQCQSHLKLKLKISPLILHFCLLKSFPSHTFHPSGKSRPTTSSFLWHLPTCSYLCW